MRSTESCDLATVDVAFAFAEDIRDPALFCAYSQLLDSEEAARHDRLLFRDTRDMNLISRALVRCCLSRVHPTIPPAEWRFVRNAHGRPEVGWPSVGRTLSFNLSHTADLACCAVSDRYPLGVDTERTVKRFNITRMAARWFSKRENDALKLLDGAPLLQRFFDYWTVKEAYAKARGVGLGIGLRWARCNIRDGRLDVELDHTADDDSAAWTFVLLAPSPAHRAAIAIKCPRDHGLRLNVRRTVPLRTDAITTLPMLVNALPRGHPKPRVQSNRFAVE